MNLEPFKRKIKSQDETCMEGALLLGIGHWFHWAAVFFAPSKGAQITIDATKCHRPNQVKLFAVLH